MLYNMPQGVLCQMLFSYKHINHSLQSLHRKVDIIMAQVDDLKAAVKDEISDVQDVLNRLQTNPVVQDNPDIAVAIQQLQESHKATQAVLNKPTV